MGAKIIVRDNGSLRIEGDVELFDMSGNKYDLAGRTAFSLCRCGATKRPPFCDSSHKTSGFVSVCTAYTLEPPKV
jgi:CDGSH-type Zn-finger protein